MSNLPQPFRALRRAAALCAAILCPLAAAAADRARPNVVLIFADDLGYADIGPFGAPPHSTPNLDRMAAEGRKFSNFYVAQAVCSASRAALLTGCYPNRLGIHGALGPQAKHGLNPSETTIAEMLKTRGYQTAIYGKWHLGHHAKFLPTRQGFDEYHGLPYSNDMWPSHPEAAPGSYPDLPLIEGERVVALNPDQSKLTHDLTRRAVDFIERHQAEPFFVYLPHPMPHVPIYASEPFQGKTGRGLYADVIREIDWSVGEILATLKRLDLDDNTLVIFTSDNGPWLSYGDHAGSALPLREGKGTAWEGGVRVPCLMRWPGKVPAGTLCDEPVMTIDILPTLAELAGAELPAARIDGKSIRPLVEGRPNATSPHEALFFYYNTGELHAVRSGPWKLYAPHTYRTLAGRQGGVGGKPVKYENTRAGWELYNLAEDVEERVDKAAANPELVAKLQAFMDQARADLGDSLTQTKGSGLRAAGAL